MLEPASMPQVDRIETSKGPACPTCKKPLADGSQVCAACGAAHGEGHRCPHCSALSDVEPHAALGFRCRVCGGPRIPLDVPGVALGAGARQALENAARAQTNHLMFSAAGWLLVGMGGLALLVAAAVLMATSPGWLASAATLFACAVPGVAGTAALTRAAVARQRRAQALHLAQVSAVSDIQAVTGELDAARAAKLLRINTEQAELLLAEASVGALLGEAPAPRLRVTEESSEPTTDPIPEPDADAERGHTER